MKKQIPTVILAFACAVLAVALHLSRQENAALRQENASLVSLSEQMATAGPAPAEAARVETAPVETVQAGAAAGSLPEEESATAGEAASAEAEESAGRRMMSSIAKMMENPTMNKVMEASQRGAVGALYSDLIEYLDLNKEETEYFMDLLMYRQMKQMDLGMKMMAGGDVSEEEKKEMIADIKEATDLVKKEMKAFLNDDEDYDEFEFYEKTMGERMMLSQMDQQLTGTDSELSDETYRELLGMMHDAKNDFEFTTDLHDDENMDMSAERFSKENIDRFTNDMDELYAIIIDQANAILTPAQLDRFREAITATLEMQKVSMEMAAQMFGGGE
jgi:hypothetical protein